MLHRATLSVCHSVSVYEYISKNRKLQTFLMISLAVVTRVCSSILVAVYGLIDVLQFSSLIMLRQKTLYNFQTLLFYLIIRDDRSQ